MPSGKGTMPVQAVHQTKGIVFSAIQHGAPETAESWTYRNCVLLL